MHTVLQRTAPGVPSQWWVVFITPERQRYWVLPFDDVRDAFAMASYLNGGELKLTNSGFAELARFAAADVHVAAGA